ncbi:MAG: tripartite tricarboxylate transporter substrate binding protein [Proteobacteria bacterium]|nr:tripartite tricarboxylate transporter substrate binding protein [Pseudomonadota bacterium]
MHQKRRQFILTSLAAGSALALPAVAPAQDSQDYPNQTITIVVPFSPAGGVDTMARLLAEELRASLKQNIIVDNKPGASGMIGARAVAKAKPDGYTLLMGSAGETAINAFIYKSKMQYSPSKELAPIALVARVPNVLVASKSFPPNTIEQLVDYAKKNPGKVVYSSSGVGNPQHLNGALLEQMADIRMVHAPYKGAAGQLVDLISGNVPITFTSYAAAKGFLDDGKLKAIAVTSAKRADFAPNIPAIAEYAPLAKYDLENWFGLFATAGTPEAIQQKLSMAVNEALRKPELAKRLRDQGAVLTPMDLQQFRDFVQAQTNKFQHLVESVNIKVE